MRIKTAGIFFIATILSVACSPKSTQEPNAIAENKKGIFEVFNPPKSNNSMPERSIVVTYQSTLSLEQKKYFDDLFLRLDVPLDECFRKRALEDKSGYREAVQINLTIKNDLIESIDAGQEVQGTDFMKCIGGIFKNAKLEGTPKTSVLVITLDPSGVHLVR